MAAASLSLILAAPAQGENAIMRQGIAEYRSGNYAAAAGHLSAALTTEFNDPVLHYYLGNSFQYLKQPESATREYRIAYALQPDGEIGRYAKQALGKMGMDADRIPSSADSLFVKLPRQPLKLDPKIAAKLDAKVLAALQASMPLIMPTGPAVPSPPEIPGGLPPHAGTCVPLSKDWLCGRKFDSANLPEPSEEQGSWFIVPDWFAGTWAEAAGTMVPIIRTEYDTDPSTEQLLHRLEQPQHWGEVKDRSGTIWTHPILPITYQHRASGELIVQILVEVKPLILTNDIARILFHWITFTVDKNQIIKKALQSEQISAFVPVGDDYSQETESIREYNEFGQPERLYQYRCYVKRVRHAVLPLTTSEHNYPALFRKYLTEHHMTNLLPVQ